MCKLNFSTYYYPINIFRTFNFQPHLSLFDYAFACNANSHQPTTLHAIGQTSFTIFKC